MKMHKFIKKLRKTLKAHPELRDCQVDVKTFGIQTTEAYGGYYDVSACGKRILFPSAEATNYARTGSTTGKPENC